MRSNVKSMLLTMLAGMAFGLLAGCGGSGGGNTGDITPQPQPVTKPTVSGTASEGALITGKTVKLKDANGKSASDVVTDATTGKYTIEVTDLTPPFLVAVTGTNGTYVSLAPSAGVVANINPMTTAVVALAAGITDVPALFAAPTPSQISAIKANYIAKAALVTESIKSELPTGAKVEDYFTGAITAAQGIDAVFDSLRIAVTASEGIIVKLKDTTAATVLTVPVATIVANTVQSLPVLVRPAKTPAPAPVAPSTPVFTPVTPPVPAPPVNSKPVPNAGADQKIVVGSVVTLDGSASTDAEGSPLTYKWTLLYKPSTSSATLSSTTVVKPTFTADVTGNYIFALGVNDGTSNGIAEAAVTVTAIANNGTISMSW